MYEVIKKKAYFYGAAMIVFGFIIGRVLIFLFG